MCESQSKILSVDESESIRTLHDEARMEEAYEYVPQSVIDTIVALDEYEKRQFMIWLSESKTAVETLMAVAASSLKEGA